MTDPYADVARWYDAEFEGANADIAGYARRAVPGRLLVLGCGTGRVPRGLAGSREIVGLDRSGAMLARARGFTPVEGDMRDFALGSFAEIVIPNASFSFLPTRADQDACLRACRRALPAGAPLSLDLPMPDFGLLGRAHSPEAPAWEGVVDGEPVRRSREVHRRPVAARLELIDRFYVQDRLVATSILPLRLIFPAELEWMLEAAGFVADELWGDHAGGPLREGCDRLLVRAVAV